MGTIYINNQPHEIGREGRSVLDVCLSLGFDIPYFCWHPALHSVGACRQCAVKLHLDEKDARGRIVMSCMTPAKDGTRISTDDPEVLAFRARMIELLMRNHPHDCPVCDEGGECHLQDMTVMTGHVYRRNRFPKRTYRNQQLGPFINHEMNRCIQCYRCVRFYRDYAGGRDLQALGWHDHVYFGRHKDGVLESVFSGNLVEVCPTGVFTDKTFKRHFTRLWDLQTAPSICVHCGLGCNTIPGERYGTLRRIRARYHHEVNGYFLCDRGRFGYEFVNSGSRIRQPFLRDEAGMPRPVSRRQAVEHAARLLKETKVIGIGSPRASLETNFVLRKMVGNNAYYQGMPDNHQQLVTRVRQILATGPAPSASLRDVQESDAVLILGDDPAGVAPMLAMALRQALMNSPRREAVGGQIPLWDDSATREAVQWRRGPCFIATPDQTELDQEATAICRAAPADLARLGFAVAHAIDPASPSVEGLGEGMGALAAQISHALMGCAHPLVVSGVCCGSRSLIESAANVAWALRRKGRPAKLCFTVPECNSVGVQFFYGENLSVVLEAVREGKADTVLIVENDIYRHLEAGQADELLETAKHLIVLDHVANGTTAKAELLLPAATFAEGEGTFVNNEGRAQRFFQVFVPEGDVHPSWEWLHEIGLAGGRLSSAWSAFDAVLADMAEEVPAFAGLPDSASSADFRMTGGKIPRQSHRYSGRTAMTAHISVSEPKPPDDPHSPLSFSMEGSACPPPPSLISRYWAPGWNSVQAINKFQMEVGGVLRGGDPGLRLIEAATGAAPDYFVCEGKSFAKREGEWLLIPTWHAFGSEELSNFSAAIVERAGEAYVGLGPRDALRLGIMEGENVVVETAGRRQVLPLRLRPSLPEGLALLPVGFPGLLGVEVPAWGRIAAARQDAEARDAGSRKG